MALEFLTILRNGPEGNSISRLALDNELREEFARSFTVAAGKWQEDSMMKTQFKDGYKLADNEIFEIKQYNIAPDMLNALRFPQEYSEFNAETDGVASLKAIVMVNVQGEKITAIFKPVSKARRIEPTKNLAVLCSRGSYAKLNRPTIVIDDRISAIIENGDLFFRSPATVKQVLSLKDYMTESSDLEIMSFLESRFKVDAEKVLAVVDPWMRKRFASLIGSTLFDDHEPVDIIEAAKEFGTEIPLQLTEDRTKFVISEDKGDIKMVLKFLNEEYYKGVLTGKDYQTSAPRPLAKPESFGGPPRKQGLKF